MDQADAVRGLQRLGDLFNDAHRPPQLQRPVGERAVQIAAFDQPHVHVEATVDLPVIVDRNHVRGVQPRRRVCLATKSLHEQIVVDQLGRQQFYGHGAVVGGVIRAPHFAHTAAAQQRHQPVAPERGALHSNLPANCDSATP